MVLRLAFRGWRDYAENQTYRDLSKNVYCLEIFKYMTLVIHLAFGIGCKPGEPNMPGPAVKRGFKHCFNHKVETMPDLRFLLQRAAHGCPKMIVGPGF